MNQTARKPRTVYLVGWCSILLGLILLLSGAGNAVAQYLNFGAISEYTVILQIAVAITVITSSVYFIKGSRNARAILEVTLWLVLFGSLSWIATEEPAFSSSLSIAMLPFWVPLALLIYGTRSTAVKSYANGT